MTASKLKTLFASWWTTAALLLSLAAAYVAFTFAENPYAGWVQFVFRTPLGLALYIGLALNLLAAGIRIAYDRLNHSPLLPDKIRTMDVWAEIPIHPSRTIRETTEWMGKKGFSGTVRENRVIAVKGRFSFLPGTIMRLGTAMLLLSVLTSMIVRDTETMVLHEGKTRKISGVALTASSVTSSLPEDFLQVGDERNFLLEHAEAFIDCSGTAGVVTSRYPVRICGRYFRLVHLGYVQQFFLTTGGRNFEKTAELDILPPGKTGILTLPMSNMFLTVSLEPEKTISKGLLKGRQFNLASPLYRVIAQHGKNKSNAAVTLKPGQSRKVKGFSISLGENSLFVQLQVVSDPALPWIYFGMMLALGGLLLMFSRFFWYKKEMIVLHRDSSLLIGYNEEFFKKWAIERFDQWKDELLRLNMAENTE